MAKSNNKILIPFLCLGYQKNIQQNYNSVCIVQQNLDSIILMGCENASAIKT